MDADGGNGPLRACEDAVEPSAALSRIAVYMHVATLGRYEEVLTELLDAVFDSSLIASGARIRVNVVGEGPLRLEDRHASVEVSRTGQPVTAYEMPTLQMIREDAMAGRVTAALYLNCLGGRHQGPDYEVRRAWRELIAFKLIEEAADCLRQLESSDVVGVQWVERPLPHMTSNNWWADGSYLAKLPDPVEYSDRVEQIDLGAVSPLWAEAASRRRHAGEFWLGAGSPRAPVSRYPLTRSFLPPSRLGVVPWWGVYGVEWGRLARADAAGRAPLGHWRVVIKQHLRELLRIARDDTRRRL